MSKNKPKKKKVVTTKRVVTTKTTSSRSRSRVLNQKPKQEMIFGKQNYIYMGIGVALIMLGMLLMLGGDMPNPDVWDPDIIYSFRRTVLAPFTILAGLIVEIYAIFRD